MNAIDEQKIRRFVMNALMINEGIVYFLLVPIVAFHVWSNMSLDEHQIGIIVFSIPAAILYSMIPTVIFNYTMLTPRLRYCWT